MIYCSGNTYCCLWGKRIGRAIHIATLTPLNIVLPIHIAAYGANVSVEQYILLQSRHEILVWQFLLLPMRQTYRSTIKYCCAYNMTNCSSNTYCCLRDKRICQTRRISALMPWHIILAIHIAACGANVSVEQYLLLRLRHDILFWQYILLPVEQQ